MLIIPGIVIGLILGSIFAVGITLYGLNESNQVGTLTEDSSHYITEDDPVIYHVYQDV